MTTFNTVAYVFTKAVSILLTVALIVACLFFGFIYYCNLAGKDVPTLGPFQMYVVLSDSMTPSIRVNDAVIVKETEPDALKVNDVITFSAFESNVVITHRIIGAEKTAQGYEFRTKGDNNNVEDSFTTPESHVIGKYILKIPKLASFLNIAMQRPYFIALIVAAVIILQILLGWAEKKLLPETGETQAIASGTGEEEILHTLPEQEKEDTSRILPEQEMEVEEQSEEEGGAGHEEGKPQDS